MKGSHTTVPSTLQRVHVCNIKKKIASEATKPDLLIPSGAARCLAVGASE